ncbi:MAG TPA: S26 family signal peptidase [Tepidisphaeraceae bacterium]|nr:S26 family signal peptidase [Tepidisphaeraceae bacterium]
MMESSEQTPPSQTGGIKDTIESILIAFILAFVFRAFIVEAFVIPTGSMAPTLMGAHMRFRCPDCGYVFDVNYSPPNEADEEDIPRFASPIAEIVYNAYGQKERIVRPKIFNIRCPNCGFRMGDEEYSHGRDFGVPPAVVTDPPVHYGDRILVLKYQYLFGQPRRWDVVVFKSPDVPYGKTAADYDYSVNFIKRLVGKPGEALMIVDGDVYIAKGAWKQLSDYQVQTKPYSVQQALWRLVFDDDYYPRGLKRYTGEPWRQPWTQQAGSAQWDLGHDPKDGRRFKFDHLQSTGDIYFDPDANPFVDKNGNSREHALTDWLAYDITSDQGRIANTFNTDVDGPLNPVSDLKLQLTYDRKDGSGPLKLDLRKIDHTFTAELTPAGARLLMRVGNGSEQQLGPTWKADVPQPWRVEFANADYRVSLRINGQEVLSSTPEEYHPNLQMLIDAYNQDKQMPPPAVRISAADQNCVLSHISLWRDVYYINRGPFILRGTPEDFPNHVVRLNHAPGKDEYFCLGDNSLVSEDGRYWKSPVDLPAENLEVPAGVVPERFLLGKAFFVYWPAGFRPFASAPDVIPNFGEMRFIH